MAQAAWRSCPQSAVFYCRAIVAGAEEPMGENEDFVTESYTLGIYPRPIIVESVLVTP